MTWKECKLAAMAKMDGLKNGSVDWAEEVNRNYLAAMPHAANEAMQRICGAGAPLRRVSRIEIEDDSARMLEVERFAPDLKSIGRRLELLLEKEDGTLYVVEKAQLWRGKILSIPRGCKGTVYFCYEAWPPQINEDTPEEWELPLAPDGASLVPLYIAGELYKDEDSTVATLYMNEFEAKLDSLYEKAGEPEGNEFCCTTGWWEE